MSLYWICDQVPYTQVEIPSHILQSHPQVQTFSLSISFILVYLCVCEFVCIVIRVKISSLHYTTLEHPVSLVPFSMEKCRRKKEKKEEVEKREWSFKLFSFSFLVFILLALYSLAQVRKQFLVWSFFSHFTQPWHPWGTFFLFAFHLYWSMWQAGTYFRTEKRKILTSGFNQKYFFGLYGKYFIKGTWVYSWCDFKFDSSSCVLSSQVQSWLFKRHLNCWSK